jgi:hypothetical protein
MLYETPSTGRPIVTITYLCGTVPFCTPSIVCLRTVIPEYLLESSLLNNNNLVKEGQQQHQYYHWITTMGGTGDMVIIMVADPSQIPQHPPQYFPLWNASVSAPDGRL